MKRKTNKEKLVDIMIENGNNFTYTEMITELLKISRGHTYVYNYNSPDRGFQSTNFCKKYNGYMVNGKGNWVITEGFLIGNISGKEGADCGSGKFRLCRRCQLEAEEGLSQGHHP